MELQSRLQTREPGAFLCVQLAVWGPGDIVAMEIITPHCVDHRKEMIL
jgi:hypothetical protein